MRARRCGRGCDCRADGERSAIGGETAPRPRVRGPERHAPARRRAGPRRRRLVHGAAHGSARLADPRTGRSRLTALGSGSAPHGVIVGPDGAPWITDGGLNAIVRVDPRTRKVRRFPLPASSGYANLNTATFDNRGRALVHRPERDLRPPRSEGRKGARLPGAARRGAVRDHDDAVRRRLLRVARRLVPRSNRRTDRAGDRAPPADGGSGRAARLVRLPWPDLDQRVERREGRHVRPADEAVAGVARSRRESDDLRRLRRRVRHGLAHRLRSECAVAVRSEHAKFTRSSCRAPMPPCASSSAGGARSGARSPAPTSSSSSPRRRPETSTPRCTQSRRPVVRSHPLKHGRSLPPCGGGPSSRSIDMRSSQARHGRQRRMRNGSVRRGRSRSSGWSRPRMQPSHGSLSCTVNVVPQTSVTCPHHDERAFESPMKFGTTRVVRSAGCTPSSGLAVSGRDPSRHRVSLASHLCRDMCVRTCPHRVVPASAYARPYP